MRVILPALAGIVLFAVLLHVFVRTPPEKLARRLRKAGGVALLALAGALLLARQFALALPVGFAGWVILRREAAVRTTGAARRTSTVRAAGLEMMLDHDTGEMDGRILSGRYAARSLSDLGLDELLELAAEFREDPESLRLLEGYLDRAHPTWRDHFEGQPADRHGAPLRAGSMDAQEAYEILGLQPDAGEAEVRDAHRRLMKQVHPDRGGSAALAAKINEAKDRLVRKHP